MEFAKDTIAYKNFTAVNYRPVVKQALLDEIELLRVSKEINPRKWDVKKFNPDNEENCFYGQVFGKVDSEEATYFKQQFVGGLADDDECIPSKGYTESLSGYTTLLEHWAISMWYSKKKGNKNEVLRVFKLLVAGKKVTNIKLHI